MAEKYRKSLPWIGIALLAILQLQVVPAHYLGHEHDEVFYVLAARSLLHGRYTLGISPGDPPLTFLTPGWPVLLLPAAWISGDSALGYQLWSWGWLVFCDVLVWIWMRRHAGPAPAAALTALFGLNPLVLHRCGVVASEFPSLAAILGIFLLADSRRPRLLGGLSAFAWLIRPAAVPVFPAVLGFYIWRRHFKGMAWCAAGAALPMLLWCFWVGFQGSRLAEVDELSMTWGNLSWVDFPLMILGNLRQTAALWGATFLPLESPSWVSLGLGSALGLLSLWGIWSHFQGDFSPAAVYVFCGLLLHMFWPWWYERYLVPFLPFLIWGLWRVLERFAARPKLPDVVGLGRTEPTTFGCSVRSMAVAAVWLCLWFPLTDHLPHLLQSSPLRSVPEFRETYAWIKEHTPGHALFTSAFYARDAYYTGRPFIPLPAVNPKAPADSFTQAFKARRADFLLWQEIPDLGSSLGPNFYWTRYLKSMEFYLQQSFFPRVYTNSQERTVVYRVGS